MALYISQGSGLDPEGLPPDANELRALAAKYRALLDLRRRRDTAGSNNDDGREGLQELSAQYPGCLRELDTLGAAEIERRAEGADAAAGGAAREPWMAWILTYHRVLRAALWLKIRRGKTRGHEDDGSILTEASRLAGLPLSATFVDTIAKPPDGRIGPIVLTTVAEAFGVPTQTVADTLFPVRRPSPYTLH
jgi:hypothetical protein